MARISGVDLPNNKRVEIALTYIYGIGRSIARRIIQEKNIDVNRKMNDLTEEEILGLRDYIERNFKVEGELRTEVAMNIKRLVEIGCYRGLRHRRGLPVRGQRTHTNARTRKRTKGRRGSPIAGKKRLAKK